MIAYFDCYSGISGDMTLGALVDAGVPVDTLIRELRRMHLNGYRLETEQVTSQSIKGARVTVRLTGQEHHHRHLADIEAIIVASSLSGHIQRRSLAVFRRLAEAEAAVHGCSVDEVHFHEVGAIDTIVDVVGSVIGLELLGVERVYASPLPLGSGTIVCDHGTLPVPAPATLELCRQAGVPVRASDVAAELVTPTGAAILCELATFERPLMRLRGLGYGYGVKELPWPNALRLWVGEEVRRGTEEDVVAIIETNIDDMAPELLGAVMDSLFEAGALDVSFEPIQMKKNRPGVKVTVITRSHEADGLASRLLRQTTSLGVRIYEARRIKCDRRQEKVMTPWGEVLIKSKYIEGQRSVAPEYEDCLRLAKTANVDLMEVYAAAMAAAER